MSGWPFVFLFGWCSLPVSAQAPSDSSFLSQILKGKSEIRDRVLAQPEKYEIQILYTQIDRDRQNRPTFRSYRYRVDKNAYFYPASTVKLPAALLALEKLNRLRVPELDKHTALQIYGTLTDNAYVADFDRGVEFLLSATIYVNQDQILNDDRYEYDTVGLPFLGSLGRTIYEYEVGRKRKFPPDLARFRVRYDAFRTEHANGSK